MKTKQLPRANRNQLQAAFSVSPGFTLIELLVVIAAMGVLAAMLLPGLARGNQQGEGVQCLNNLQRLSQAWLMYSGDNRGNLTPNGGESSQPKSPTDPQGMPGGTLAQWCPGRQDDTELSPLSLSTNAPNVGVQWIQAGLIYPYVKSAQAYLCPSDESFNTVGNQIYPHVRSESMNGWINPANNSAWTAGALDGSMRVFKKEADLSVPGPANTWLLMDENPQSINDGWMIEDPSQPSISRPGWIDCPGSVHNGACGISFCDGHAGLKKWRDPVVLSVTGMKDTQNWSDPAPKFEPDVLWLVNRSTALQTTTAFLGPQGW